MTDIKDDKWFLSFRNTFKRSSSEEKKEQLKQFVNENNFIINGSTDLENRIAASDTEEKLEVYLDKAKSILEENRKLIRDLNR